VTVVAYRRRRVGDETIDGVIERRTARAVVELGRAHASSRLHFDGMITADRLLGLALARDRRAVSVGRIWWPLTPSAQPPFARPACRSNRACHPGRIVPPNSAALRSIMALAAQACMASPALATPRSNITPAVLALYINMCDWRARRGVLELTACGRLAHSSSVAGVSRRAVSALIYSRCLLTGWARPALIFSDDVRHTRLLRRPSSGNLARRCPAAPLDLCPRSERHSIQHYWLALWRCWPRPSFSAAAWCFSDPPPLPVLVRRPMLCGLPLAVQSSPSLRSPSFPAILFTPAQYLSSR